MGEIDPFRLMRSIDERLWKWWEKFYAAEPFGDAILHRMMARIAAAVYQSGEWPHDITEEDLIPGLGHGRKHRDPSVEDDL